MRQHLGSVGTRASACIESRYRAHNKDTDSSGTSISQTLTVANPKTNTLYMFIFESPESEWDAAWKTGKQIMDTVAIDDEI